MTGFVLHGHILSKGSIHSLSGFIYQCLSMSLSVVRLGPAGRGASPTRSDCHSERCYGNGGRGGSEACWEMEAGV